MRRFAARVILAAALLFVCALPAQAEEIGSRKEALQSLNAPDPAQRAEAIAWLAHRGLPSDDAVLRLRLRDESPYVRHYAEEGLWLLWSRSGDDEIDQLMEQGMEQMQAEQWKASIATFSEVIKRKPSFAEGWNRRATVLFMAGELRKSLADCDEVVKRNPNHFGALSGYGQIYFQLEQYEKAIEYWKRALKVNPNLEGLEMQIKNAEEMLEERQRHSA